MKDKVLPQQIQQPHPMLSNLPTMNLVLWMTADYSGCGYLRTIFINDYLNSIYANRKKYEGIVTNKFFVDQNLLVNAKILHFQRQITDSQVRYIELLDQFRKKFKLDTKMIYDLDDNFLEIPDYSGAKKFYNQPFVETNLRKIVNIVDIFTVSTYELKKVIESMGGTCKVKIVPNYLPKFIYHPYDAKSKIENKKPKVLWAGSSTHFSPIDPGDFGLILDLIKNTVDDFDWVIMGMKSDNIPDWFKSIAPKVEIIDWTRSIHSFPSDLKKINADFGLAPLLDNPLNRCKSNIKLLDYASADIVSIASNLAPYKKDSLLFLHNNWEKDKHQILDIWNNPTKKQEILTKQRKFLDKYWIEDNVVKKYYKELFELDRGNNGKKK